MDSVFHIRPATEADVPALRELIELSVRALQKDDYTPEQIEGALGHALGLDTQLVLDGTYFAAEPVGERLIAGCGGWSYRKTLFGSDHGPDREAVLLDPAVDAARIRAIFVHPQWARRGLGSMILQHCEAAAQNAGFSRLEMGSTLTGVPLYTLRGYREYGRVDVPLPNGAVLPVVRMSKIL
jgi:GNAT superfamily N-acetyltransferase